jgi:hypothetical protein
MTGFENGFGDNGCATGAVVAGSSKVEEVDQVAPPCTSSACRSTQFAVVSTRVARFFLTHYTKTWEIDTKLPLNYQMGIFQITLKYKHFPF